MTVARRVVRSPSIRYVWSPVPNIAKKWGPSLVKVGPQKLQSVVVDEEQRDRSEDHHGLEALTEADHECRLHPCYLFDRGSAAVRAVS
jgi:hypothetical protein